MTNDFGKSLPFKQPSHAAKLIVLLFLSALLMVTDHTGNHLQQIRQGLSILVYPIQMAADLPVRAANWVADFFVGDRQLRGELDQLRTERPLLMAKLQRYEALEAENARLRNLLASASRVADRAMAAELLQVHPEPFTRKIVISKGSSDGVFLGQPAIDSVGVLGQVTELNLYSAMVTLITDASHAIPVQNNRNGLRTIVVGSGAPDTLSVPFLTTTADIQNGDLLVSSGMGGRFPPGYPVAHVNKIVIDPNDAFLQITATPAAQLNHNKEVLLIWPGTSQQVMPTDKQAKP